nr:intercellular adhesion molecule 4 [Marmota flaviventris]
MGSLLLLSLLLLLVTAYPGDGGVLGSQAERVQGTSGSPPAPSGTPAPFWVRISPELVVVPQGGSVRLNCSNSCPLPESSSTQLLPESSSVGTQLLLGKTLSGPGWVSYQLLNVRAWRSDVHCFVTCAGKTREATARITAYKRPRSVILEPPILVGQEYFLRCHVTHVFPVGSLMVILRRSGQVIYFESLEHFQDLNLANVTLTHVLRTGPSNLWQPLTCHARLSLHGLVIHSSSAPIMLTALAWNPASKALASISIAALVGILLAMGAAYLCKCPAKQPGLRKLFYANQAKGKRSLVQFSKPSLDQ